MSLSMTTTRFAFGVCALTAASGMANAAALVIDDTAADETISYGLNDWEGGFVFDGALVQQGLNNPVNFTVPETDTGNTFSGTWFAPGQGPAFGRIYLVEALGPDPTGLPLLISDIFTYDIVPDMSTGLTTLYGSFVSADNLGYLPTGIDPSSIFYENGQPVTLGFPGLGITIMSDAVPAPASIALLAVGGLAMNRRRRA